MSTSPFAVDASISKLLAEDYSLSFEGGHLIIEHVPYVTADKAVAYGCLVLPVTMSGDVMQDGTGDHTIWWIGDQPCDQFGQPLPGPSVQHHAVTPEKTATFMISSKPKGTGAFASTYDKIVSYVRVLSHPAVVIDPTVTATPGTGWREIYDDLPFVYTDSATARAGLADLNSKFRGHRIGIVGLGGTGSYILDHVSKTWVDNIELYDGDTFDNHNAFRAPGAADIADLRQRPNKADYFAAQYSRMHTGITAHPFFITADNLDELDGCTFVFLAAGESDDKAAILAWLRQRSIPAIEVGMGIRDEGGRLSGLLAVTNHFPDQPPVANTSAAAGHDEYDRNIQVSDLNCLNAVLAVGNWKKYIGYYATAEAVDETVYRIFTGTIRNGQADPSDLADDEPDDTP